MDIIFEDINKELIKMKKLNDKYKILKKQIQPITDYLQMQQESNNSNPNCNSNNPDSMLRNISSIWDTGCGHCCHNTKNTKYSNEKVGKYMSKQSKLIEKLFKYQYKLDNNVELLRMQFDQQREINYQQNDEIVGLRDEVENLAHAIAKQSSSCTCW